MLMPLLTLCALVGASETLVDGSTANVNSWTTQVFLDSKGRSKQGEPVPMIWRTYIMNKSDQEIAEVSAKLVVKDGRGNKLWSTTRTLKNFKDMYIRHTGSVLPRTLTKEIETPVVVPWDAWVRMNVSYTNVMSLKTYKNPDLHKAGHLMSFFWKANLDQVKAAFAKDRNLLSVSENGITPALYACRLNNKAIPEYLASIGGDLKAKVAGGFTAAHFAAMSRDPGMVDLIVKKGLSVKSADEGGLTPMHIAANYNNAVGIASLSKNKADIDAKDKIGDRPIVYACRGGWDSAFIALKNLGASFASDSKSGHGPMQAAAFCGAAMLEIVYRNGGKIQAADPPYRITPLHAAVRSMKPESIIWLLQHGADPNVKTTRGNTCYDVALSAGGEYWKRNLELWVKTYRKAPK